jgi:hypothetical protein
MANQPQAFMRVFFENPPNMYMCMPLATPCITRRVLSAGLSILRKSRNKRPHCNQNGLRNMQVASGHRAHVQIRAL